MTRPKRQPERTCVVCRTRRPQRELVRLAHVGGELTLDPEARGPGRGAYLCRRAACWRADDRDRRLEGALRTRLTAADRAALGAWLRAAVWR